jgi:CubicO group peptidase (beta-lactamase class C family)
MNAIRFRALFLALVLVLQAPAVLAQGLPRARPEEVGMSAERLDRLTEVMRGYVADGRLAGAVVLVARYGRVPYFESFGERDREAAASMTPDALFRIASQTKALVSVAVLMLQEEGALLISDPVGKHIPEYARTTVAVRRTEGTGYDVVDARRPITLRDLLTHTAGIGYGGGVARDRWEAAGIQGWYFAERDEPIGATVTRMAALPFDAQPGERFVYGYATDILGVVVERVSGLALDAFLQQRILEPLAMHDTKFYPTAQEAGRIAAVYSASSGGGIERAPAPGGMVGQGAYVEGPRRSFSGGAGLVSTASDYARFLQMLLNGGELDGIRILAPSTVELMTADHIGERYGTAGAGFGLGFEITTDAGLLGRPGSAGTFGWGGAYHSTYWVDPEEQLVVVYMSQLIPAGGLDDHGKLRVLVYQAIVPPGER